MAINPENKPIHYLFHGALYKHLYFVHTNQKKSNVGYVVVFVIQQICLVIYSGQNSQENDHHRQLSNAVFYFSLVDFKTGLFLLFFYNLPRSVPIACYYTIFELFLNQL